jgi:hypothetical protein
MSGTLDPRQIIPGYNGRLYSDSGLFLAQIPTFKCSITFTAESVNIAGSAQTVDVMQSFKVGLTFTEIHVVDDMIGTVMSALQAGTMPSFGFQGILTRPADGKQGIYVLRSCVPSGDVDLFSVQPGQHSDRQWTMTVNDFPDLQSLLVA